MSRAFPTTVAGLLISGDRVLLGLRAAWKDVFPGHWDAIAGRVEDGETPEAALVRELSEEIGVAATSYRVLETLERQLAGGKKEHRIFAVTDWVGEPINITDENDDVRWFTLAQVEAL